MAVKKSTISAVPAAPKTRRTVTLIAQAPDKYPNSDPNPILSIQLSSRDVLKMADHLSSLYDLAEMDEQNPVISGTCSFLSEIIKRLREEGELLADIADNLTVKGGAE